MLTAVNKILSDLTSVVSLDHPEHAVAPTTSKSDSHDDENSSSSPAPNTSPELLVLILSNFSPSTENSDKGALLSCCLVSRSWCNIARPIVFSELCITRQMAKNALAPSSTWSSYIMREKPKYSGLFDSPLSTIPHLVTSLRLCDPAHKILRIGLADLLVKFKHLTGLEISACDCSSLMRFPALSDKERMHFTTFLHLHCLKQNFDACSFSASRITSLILSGTNFASLAQFVVFICDFPYLEKLDMYVAYYASASLDDFGPLQCAFDPPIPAHCRLSPFLRVLHISSPSPRSILPWLLSLPGTATTHTPAKVNDDFPPIENLSLRFTIQKSDPQMIDAFLSKIGGTLKVLTMAIQCYVFSETRPPFTLAHTPHLRQLRLELGKGWYTTVKCTFPLFSSASADPDSCHSIVPYQCPNPVSSIYLRELHGLAGGGFTFPFGSSLPFVDGLLTTFPFKARLLQWRDGDHIDEDESGVDNLNADQEDENHLGAWTLFVSGQNRTVRDSSWTEQKLPSLVGRGMKVVYLGMNDERL